MKQWIENSFRNRVFASVLIITLLPIVVCNVLLMMLVQFTGEKERAAQAQESLSACVQALDSVQQQIAAISADLADSTVVRSALRQNSVSSRVLFQRLNTATAQLRDVCRVDICLRDGTCGYSTEGMAMNDYHPDWGALRAAGQSSKLEFLAEEEGKAIQAARAVCTIDGDILGYLVFTVSEQNLDALLSDCYSRTNDLFILNSAWRVLYTTSLAEDTEITHWLRWEYRSDGLNQGIADGECRFFYREYPGMNVILLMRQPMMFNRTVQDVFSGLSYLMGLTSLMLCAAYALWMAGHLFQPIHTLTDAMEAVESGNMNIIIPEDRADELGSLSRGFNRMNRKYRENLASSVERQRELDDTRVRMMQAQLNPHFLYNTLDSIKWMGVTNHVPEIANLATDLGVLLRASISWDEFITVEKELELIERYLEIQYIRFEDRFTCEIAVDETVMHCMMPKLSLQPIVENAIIHGVADLEEGYIKITSRQEGNTLVLSVTDNGCGIPEAMLQKLTDTTLRTPVKHLGMYNVNQIIRLHYGPDYGLRAWSVPGEGSTVELHLPMERQNERSADNAENLDSGR